MEALIFNQSCWIYKIDNVDVKKEFSKLLTQSNFNIVDSIEYKFTPNGYSIIWLLGESHFAAHTFVEDDVIYIELSSCIENKAKLFWKYLIKWSTAKLKEINILTENKYMP